MKTILGIGTALLGGIYAINKLAKRNPKKVVFLSRQEERPVDFVLLDEELKRMDPEIQTVFLCRTMKSGIASKVAYAINIIGPQLHALATSRVAVLDSYSAPVSILNHGTGREDSLKVIQIWHAMGALKKFSKSIVGREEGRSKELADAMNMHGNYDIILASSPESKEAFKEAFGYTSPDSDSKFIIGALPRTDLLTDLDYMEKKRVEILEAYPWLKGKKVVLYAPTLRIQDSRELEVEKAKELIDSIEAKNGAKSGFDGREFAVIISPHPVKGDHYSCLDNYGDVMTDENGTSEGVSRHRILNKYSTFELLAVCDCFVTDYSAVVYEAALAKKPIFLYAYDLDLYKNSRGFYLDYEAEMPVKPRRTSEEIAEDIYLIEKDSNEMTRHLEKVDAFAKRYIKTSDDVSNTRALAKVIISLM